MPPKGPGRPPKKVVESDSDSEGEQDRQKAAAKIYKAIKNGRNVDQTAAANAVFLSLHAENGKAKMPLIEKKIEGLETAIDEIEDASKKQAKKIKSNSDQLLWTQITVYEKKLLFRNLPLHHEVKPGGNETVVQTLQVVKDLFDAMAVDYRHLPDCFRFSVPKNKKFDKNKIPLVSATFISGQSIGAFFDAINKIKNNDKYELFRAEKDIPPLLREEHSKAQGVAYELRDKKKWKTKVLIVKAQIKLFYAEKGDTTPQWKEYDYSKHKKKLTHSSSLIADPKSYVIGTSKGDRSYERK